jgi:hypothetical protein
MAIKFPCHDPAIRSRRGVSMERSIRGAESPGSDFHNAYDLERQLEIAERRYAEARAGCDKAREELRAIVSQPGSVAADVLGARTRFDAASARCVRLRDLIDELENRLDV